VEYENEQKKIASTETVAVAPSSAPSGKKK